jgi:hypothetical protein
MAATELRDTTTRMMRVLIGDPLPALDACVCLHARSSFAALVPLGHENRPDTMVGRLHYSLSLTLSAHFR